MPRFSEDFSLRLCLNSQGLKDEFCKLEELWKKNGLEVATRYQPYLYKKYSELKFCGPLLDHLKLEYKKTWMRNQKRLFNLLPICDSLRTNSIEFLFLKGIALSSGIYRDWGVRPMADVDILVKRSQLRKALSVFAELGFFAENDGGSLTEEMMNCVHGVSLHKVGAGEIDLHWHLGNDFCSRELNEEFFRGSHTIDLLNYQVKILSLGAFLLHVIVHGTRWSRGSNLRWVLDSKYLLSSLKMADWEVFVEQTNASCLNFIVTRGLDILRHEYQLKIPEQVVQELNLKKPTFIDILEYKSRVCNYEKELFGYLSNHIFDFLRCASYPRKSPIKFLLYLGNLKNLKSVKDWWLFFKCFLRKKIRKKRRTDD